MPRDPADSRQTPKKGTAPVPEASLADAPPIGGARRNFLTKMLAVLTSSAIVAVSTAPGISFFLDPLLRKRRGSGGGDGRRDADGFLSVTPLAAIPSNGRP